MRLSFFIRPETETLREIKKVLEKFNIKEQGECEDSRIAIFNGHNGRNFYYTGHRLFQSSPEGISTPFLVSVGDRWTMEGLVNLLTSYAKFSRPPFDSDIFPKRGDEITEEEIADDKKLTREQKEMLKKRLQESKGRLRRRLELMKETIKNCQYANKEELSIIGDIIGGLHGATVYETKQRIIDYLLTEREVLSLPWGNLPTAEDKKKALVVWLAKVESSFPGEITYKQVSMLRELR